jgi:cation transport ATPase
MADLGTLVVDFLFLVILSLVSAGIAIGAGTEVAIAAAQMVLVKSDLRSAC